METISYIRTRISPSRPALIPVRANDQPRNGDILARGTTPCSLLVLWVNAASVG